MTEWFPEVIFQVPVGRFPWKGFFIGNVSGHALMHSAAVKVDTGLPAFGGLNLTLDAGDLLEKTGVLDARYLR